MKLRKGESPLFLVDVNILPQHYRPRPLPIKGALLVSLLLALFLGLLPLYGLREDVRAEALRLDAEGSRTGRQLQQARLSLNTAKKLEETTRETQGVAESVERDKHAIATRDAGLSRGLNTIVGSLPPGVRLSTIGQTGGQLSVEGKADDEAQLIAYALALGKSGHFSAVSISSLNKDPSGQASGLFFQVVLSSPSLEHKTLTNSPRRP